jgi:photosystem II stability/assembly factor-like uncharacterized protein
MGQQERVLIGTSEGLHELGTLHRSHLAGSEVTALATAAGHWWAIVDGQTITHRDGDGPWDEVAAVPEPPATCLAPTAAGLLVGTTGAHLFRVGAGVLVRLDAFETVEGRAAWYTPWGDPPDTRSIAAELSGAIYVNVHVGGVVRSTDGGRSWRPTLDIETDVHQVLAHSDLPGHVFAASAVGLVMSADSGESWRILTEGLHARYLRAVAVAGENVLVSASTGPGGRRAAVYRARVDGHGDFKRCRLGLPEWFGDNVDTHCLAARGRTVVVGTGAGRVYASHDGGASFALLTKGLPAIQCVALG